MSLNFLIVASELLVFVDLFLNRKIVINLNILEVLCFFVDFDIFVSTVGCHLVMFLRPAWPSGRDFSRSSRCTFRWVFDSSVFFVFIFRLIFKNRTLNVFLHWYFLGIQATLAGHSFSGRRYILAIF